MHTNTCENNKFIFYKIVHNEIYHDLIMPSGCETGCQFYNYKACGAVAKWEDPVLKGAGLRNGSVHTTFTK